MRARLKRERGAGGPPRAPLLAKLIRRVILFSLLLVFVLVFFLVVFVVFFVLVVFVVLVLVVLVVLVFLIFFFVVIVVGDGSRVRKFALIGGVEIGAFVTKRELERHRRNRFAEQISFFTEPDALDAVSIQRYDREGLAARFQIDHLAGHELHFSLLDERNTRCAD